MNREELEAMTDTMEDVVTALQDAGFDGACIVDTGGGVECIHVPLRGTDLSIGAFNEIPGVALMNELRDDLCDGPDLWVPATAAAIVARVREMSEDR